VCVVHSCVFYGSFFAFGYTIPLSLVCVLYGLMLRRLRTRKAPSAAAAAAAGAGTTRRTAAAGSACSRKSKRTLAADSGDSTSTSRRSSSKRRVTRLVIVVVVIFAVSWLPAQVHNRLIGLSSTIGVQNAHKLVTSLTFDVIRCTFIHDCERRIPKRSDK